MRTAILGCALALACMAPTRMLYAQAAPTPTDLEARRALLEQVRTARAAGDHARALELIERVGQIQMNSSVHRVAAQELAALGQLADALGRANECVSLAEREPASGPRDQVMAECQALATSLAAGVGRIVIDVPRDAPAGLSIRVGPRTVSSALWGVEYPVTPGAVVVEGDAPGAEHFRREITVTAGAVVRVPVEIRRVTMVQTTPVVTTAPGPTASVTPLPEPTDSPPPGVRHGETVHSPVGLVSAGAGLVGLIAGGVMWVVANGQYNALQNGCATNLGGPDCASYEDALRARQSIETLDNAALGTAIAGGVLLAGGAVLWFALTHEERVQEHAGIRVLPSLGGVVVEGRF